MLSFCKEEAKLQSLYATNSPIFPLTTTPPLSLQSPTPLHPKTKNTLNPSNSNPIPFSLLSRSLLFRASAAFDNLDEQSTELSETEAESETEQEEEDEDDEQTEAQLAEAARLFVGNLPYAMTSSKLAQVFGEAR
ncbi:hypothetical protein LOK49_LG07G02399 [Camellia lanceoleosa]|uniref:Uncharacterized protein n=1 Tax=Camellia lanceoleosa TaxID=1840588 RepID=A0ACC0H855_9ERIC|nr:hypothetical protein LOK49_LG07G02399 [Camellia lanceoleosa]